MIEEKRKRIVVVLGMHRSGTSAITKGLELLGVGLGDDLHPAGSDNPTGFWEDRECLDINEQLLKHLGSAYDRLDFGWNTMPQDSYVQELKDRAIAFIARKLDEGTGVWGVKDPRMCRLLVFWNEVFTALSCEVGVVIAVRNPRNVVASLEKREALLVEKSYFLWLQHVLPSLSFMVKNPHRLVVDFDEFLEAPYAQLARMADKLDLLLPERKSVAVKDFEKNFLDASLRHMNFTETDLTQDKRASKVVIDCYHLIARLANDNSSLEGTAVRDELAELHARLLDMQPAFDYINVLEANGEALAAYDQIQRVIKKPGWQENLNLRSLTGELNQRLKDLSPEFYSHVLDAKARLIDMQLCEIEKLTHLLSESKIWAEKLTKEKESLVSGLAESQAAWAKKLDKDKAWLESEVSNRDALIEEMNKGKAWLESEVSKRDALIEEMNKGKTWLETQLVEYHALVEQMNKGKAWLEGEVSKRDILAEEVNGNYEKISTKLDVVSGNYEKLAMKFNTLSVNYEQLSLRMLSMKRTRVWRVAKFLRLVKDL